MTPLESDYNMTGKIFQDRRALARFNTYYDSFQRPKKELFAKKVRELADKKITTDEYNEFYITYEDLNKIALTI